MIAFEFESWLTLVLAKSQNKLLSHQSTQVLTVTTYSQYTRSTGCHQHCNNYLHGYWAITWIMGKSIRDSGRSGCGLQRQLR